MKFFIAGIAVESILPLPVAAFLSCVSEKEADVQITFASVSSRDQAAEESHCSDGIAVYSLQTGMAVRNHFTSRRTQIFASKISLPEHLSGRVFSVRIFNAPSPSPSGMSLAHEGILSLHAACVEEDGRAVCLQEIPGSASLRAQAWIEALNAEFISGDRPPYDWERWLYGLWCALGWKGTDFPQYCTSASCYL